MPTAYGDVYNFSLKNSGISCSVSWKQFFSPKPRAGDDEHGVLPDVPVGEKMLAEFRGEADPVLAVAVKYSLQQR